MAGLVHTFLEVKGIFSNNMPETPVILTLYTKSMMVLDRFETVAPHNQDLSHA